MAIIAGNYYSETDYSKFKKLDQNRIVTKQRLAALIKSFRDGVVNTMITVNANMEIVDGQGRFEARKALGLPILYVIDPDANIDDCRRINSANKPWGMDDFVASYAGAGNENYKRLYFVADKLEIPYARVLRLANHTTNGGGSGEIVVSGRLVFSIEDQTKVFDLVSKINEIANALGKTTGLNNAFWVGCKIAIETEGYQHNKMLNACACCRMRYVQMSKLEDELKQLSEIYNYKSKKDKLYFEDYMRNRGRNVRDYEEGKTKRKDVSSL